MMMSELRISLPQILAVSIKNIILIAFGMTLGFPTVLIPALQENPDEEKTEEFYLNKAQISWISSINLIFVPLGCVFSGSFTAFLGRRRAMQLVCFPILAAWIIFYFSNHVNHLYIGLCLSGFTGGMLEAPVLVYVAEVSTPKLRGILAATGSFCIILGIFSQFLMGLFLNWRTITLLSTSAPMLAIFFLFFVPESPHWLILKNRDEEAKKSLMWLRGWQKSFESVKVEYDELYKSLSKTTESPTSNDHDESLLKSFQRRTFLLPYFICSLAFFIGHFSGMTTLQTYAVPIFAQLKAPVDKYFATMLLGIVELVGTGICVILVRFVGKRKLTFFSTFGCSFCFFSTAIYAFFIVKTPEKNSETNIMANVTQEIEEVLNTTTKQITDAFMMITSTEPGVSFTEEFISRLEISSNDVNETSSTTYDLQTNHYSWIPLTLLLASALLSHMGIRLLPWMLVGEIYPAKIRGIASGMTGGTSYIFGFLSNKLFLTMVEAFTLPGTFLLYSCIGAFGCIILFVLLPETEGRSLQEIENHFSGKRKLPRTMKRKEPVIDEPFPQKFDIEQWESNEKFKKHLQTHKISLNNGQRLKNNEGPIMGMKRKNPELVARKNILPAALVSDGDYDTPL